VKIGAAARSMRIRRFSFSSTSGTTTGSRAVNQ
jgi:hypothetical protein